MAKDENFALFVKELKEMLPDSEDIEINEGSLYTVSYKGIDILFDRKQDKAINVTMCVPELLTIRLGEAVIRNNKLIKIVKSMTDFAKTVIAPVEPVKEMDNSLGQLQDSLEMSQIPSELMEHIQGLDLS